MKTENSITIAYLNKYQYCITIQLYGKHYKLRKLFNGLISNEKVIKKHRKL